MLQNPQLVGSWSGSTSGKPHHLTCCNRYRMQVPQKCCMMPPPVYAAKPHRKQMSCVFRLGSPAQNISLCICKYFKILKNKNLPNPKHFWSQTFQIRDLPPVCRVLPTPLTSLCWHFPFSPSPPHCLPRSLRVGIAITLLLLVRSKWHKHTPVGSQQFSKRNDTQVWKLIQHQANP